MAGFVGIPGIVILLVLALLFFGRKRLPGLGRGFRGGVREFKIAANRQPKHTLSARPDEIPADPIAPPESRRAFSAATFGGVPLVTAARAWAWKIAGIILYVDPLPTPVSTKTNPKPAVNTASESCAVATSRIPMPTASARKTHVGERQDADLRRLRLPDPR